MSKVALLALHRIIIALAALVCMPHARQMQQIPSAERETPLKIFRTRRAGSEGESEGSKQDALKSLAAVLLASNPTLAFNPSCPGACAPRRQSAQTGSHQEFASIGRSSAVHPWPAAFYSHPSVARASHTQLARDFSWPLKKATGSSATHDADEVWDEDWKRLEEERRKKPEAGRLAEEKRRKEEDVDELVGDPLDDYLGDFGIGLPAEEDREQIKNAEEDDEFPAFSADKEVGDDLGDRLSEITPEVRKAVVKKDKEMRREADAMLEAIYKKPKKKVKKTNKTLTLPLGFRPDENTDDEVRHVMSLKINNFSVQQMQDECRALGLKIGGQREELVKRLQDVQRRLAFGLPIRTSEAPRYRDYKWFMLIIGVGKDLKVKDLIEVMMEEEPWAAGMVNEIYLPHKKPGSARTSVFPGKIFLHMKMNQQILDYITYEIADTRRFQGNIRRAREYGKTRESIIPTPMSDEQFNRVQEIVRNHKTKKELDREKEEKNGRAQSPFKVGDAAFVEQGPFEGLHGPVAEVDVDAKTLKVEVKVMGRETLVDVPWHAIRGPG